MEPLYIRPDDACALIRLPWQSFKALRDLNSTQPFPTIQLATGKPGARPTYVTVQNFINWINQVAPLRFTANDFDHLNTAAKPLAELETQK